MYIKISTKRDINRNDATKTAEVIREIIKAFTIPNFSSANLNSAVVNPVNSAIFDNKTPGWTLIGSSKEGVNLGSGSNFELGDTWTISKGSKQLTFEIADSSSGGFGNFAIEVSSNTSAVSAPLIPGCDLSFVTGAGSNVTISGKPGLTHSI
jgi:hypothetical protein